MKFNLDKSSHSTKKSFEISSILTDKERNLFDHNENQNKSNNELFKILYLHFFIKNLNVFVCIVKKVMPTFEFYIFFNLFII